MNSLMIVVPSMVDSLRDFLSSDRDNVQPLGYIHKGNLMLGDSYIHRNSGILGILLVALHIGREVVQLGGISGFHRIISLGTACGDSVFCSVVEYLLSSGTASGDPSTYCI